MLAGLDPFELTTPVLNEVVKRAGIQKEDIDEVIFSNLGVRQIDNGRTYALQADFPLSVPGMNMTRGCGSTITSAAIAAAMIQAGMGDTYLIAGMESNSRGALMMERPTKAYQATPPAWSEFYITPPKFQNEPMGKLRPSGSRNSITLPGEECDEFACWSQEKAQKSLGHGIF